MPMSSAEIAAANGAFQTMYQQQAQYANIVGQYNQNPFGHRDPGAMGESMAGRAMNRGAAIGMPLATGAMALAGLDPLSLGLRAGGAGMSAGMGFGGGVALGAGAFGGAMIGMAGAGYAGNQIMTGAQQVQGFNQQMRGSYGFHNPMASSGHGFSQPDIREIGNAMRGIAGSGEQGFDELGRMAAQMGRMGMANGVRNAKEFGEKFREMMATVKTIAKEMGTTLEEAQTMMASMRGSGIFNRQAGVSQRIRSTAVAGGLATTEVTGMMNIGSQISRMFGGTGRQGAMGGMEAIGQVGTAVQAGVLSEEDIYNSTGMTGAEGRRAMATQQLEQTGSFLKSSKGRWFMASLAGKDGRLDRESIANWRGGGMDVESTRNQAHQNLHGVGRANFIRNEGRLRGAVMEEFGGLAPAMAMQQWAQGRGIDINNMDDRSMLFAQRQLGMGRDEADSAIKMARALPELMQARREAQGDDTQTRARLERQSQQGVEGIRRRFEVARNKVNNELQASGQRIMNTLSDTMSDWANRLAGSYEEVGVSGLNEITHALERGGGGAAGVLRAGKHLSMDKSLTSFSGAGAFGGSAGWDSARGEQLKNLRMGASLGEVGELGGALGSFTQSNKSMLMEQYSSKLAGMSGEDRISAMRNILRSDKAAFKQFSAGTDVDRIGRLQGIEKAIGVKDEARAGTMVGAKPREGILQSIANIFQGTSAGQGRTTVLGQQEYFGRNMLRRGGGAGSATSDGFANPLGDPGFGPGATGTRGFEQDVDAETAQGAGAYLQGEEGRRRVFGMLTGSAEERNFADQDIQVLKARMGRGEDVTKQEKGRLSVLENAKVAMDYDRMMTAGKGKLSDSDWASLRKKYAAANGLSVDQVTNEMVEGGRGAILGAAKAEFDRLSAAESTELRRRGAEEVRGLTAGGLATISGKTGKLELSETTLKQLMKTGGQGAVDLARAALGATDEEQKGDWEAFEKSSGAFQSAMSRASVKELQGMARSMAGTTQGEQASELLGRGRRMTSQIARAGREGLRGGAGGTAAVARELGIDLDKDQLMGLGGLGAGEAAARLAGRAGIESKEFTSQIAQAIEAARGGKGQAAAGLLGKAVGDLSPEQRKKLQEMQKGGPDPMEKLVEKIGDGNKFLSDLVAGNKLLLRAVYNLELPKDGEAKPPAAPK